jgi:hypothetical protein
MKKFFLPTLSCVVLFNQAVLADARTDNPEYQYLNNLALQHDPNRTSGKGSNWHNYTEVYAQYFAPLKDKPLKFLEIGIFEGNGVKLWESYFKNGELHFIDITFNRVKYFSKRSHYHLADQENAEDLKRVMKTTGGNFDLIIDDGGHTMNQQYVSFMTLFPYLKNGGMYIVEDLHTSYWKEYGGGGSLADPKSGQGTFINFLKRLVDEVNFVGARTGSANHHAIPPAIQSELNWFREQIYSMHFYDSLCIIIKR